ncbi:HAD-like protein [Patellaria atrata CBS 101060]|uniref:HAD-like protein n=1 Tax=Patellaria atrata CBS 101060 TaxID=1346257 RepID=A0A9P4SGV8_9PEZI|nr:HAD-like protein [Patellaria atrata CBS 101060]
MSDLPPIKACLFDMDGLLIDSEDLYSICTNKILREHGRPELPWSIKARLQGRPGPEAQHIFESWAQLPLTTEEYLTKQTELQSKHFPSTKPLPGVPQLLQTLANASPPIRIALATSSNTRNFKLKTAHLEDPLFKVFDPEHRVLGDDSRIPKGKGKPAPDIWLVALETINASLRAKGEAEIKPVECLVFEDSVTGVESGRRAGMQVVWCPHVGLLKEYKGREEEVLAGLTGEHKEPKDEGEQIIEDVKEDAEEKEKQAGLHRKGEPGQIGDGWGRLLETLENFPYESYGIKPQWGT